ncbi:hypothetical protein CBM2585_B50178 [Cupriavidus taiwanensis]|nr:hypothetical protein CBM2585_B50178 [Cupriavidus taiwanensis]
MILDFFLRYRLPISNGVNLHGNDERLLALGSENLATLIFCRLTQPTNPF